MIRVLHLPTNLGGRWALAQAERQLDLDSAVLIKWHNIYTYDCDICLHWERKSIFGIFISMLKTFFLACHEKECYGGQCNSGILDKRRRARIKKAQKYVNQNEIGKKLKIVHAPTERGAKGTKYIMKTLGRLKSRYRNIEIILVENVPYRRALEIYKEANIVVD